MSIDNKTVADLFHTLGVDTITHDSLITELRAALFDSDTSRAMHWIQKIVDVSEEMGTLIQVIEQDRSSNAR